MIEKLCNLKELEGETVRYTAIPRESVRNASPIFVMQYTLG